MKPFGKTIWSTRRNEKIWWNSDSLDSLQLIVSRVMSITSVAPNFTKISPSCGWTNTVASQIFTRLLHSDRQLRCVKYAYILRLGLDCLHLWLFLTLVNFYFLQLEVGTKRPFEDIEEVANWLHISRKSLMYIINNMGNIFTLPFCKTHLQIRI